MPVEPLLARLGPASHGLDYGCGPGPALATMLREEGHGVTDRAPQPALIGPTPRLNWVYRCSVPVLVEIVRHGFIVLVHLHAESHISTNQSEPVVGPWR